MLWFGECSYVFAKDMGPFVVVARSVIHGSCELHRVSRIIGSCSGWAHGCRIPILL